VTDAAERCAGCGTELPRPSVVPFLLVPVALGAASMALVVLGRESLSTVELLMAVTAAFALLVVSLGALARRLLRTPACPKCGARAAE